MTTPILALQEIAEGVASQAALHNTALRELEARSVRVLSKTTTAPPGSPAESDSYIIPGGSPNSWLGAANQIAVYLGAVWTYYTPVEGVTVWVNDLNALYTYNGAAWDATVAATSPLTTKGDLYGFSTLNARLGVGANDQILTADSTQAMGLKWAAPAAQAQTIKWGGQATYAGNIYTLVPVPAATAHVNNDTYLVYIATQNTSNNPLMRADAALGSVGMLKPDGSAVNVNDVKVGFYIITLTGSGWRFHKAPMAVSLFGNETIADIKTFTSPISGVAAVAAADLVTKAQLDAKVYAGRITNSGGGSPTIAVAYGPTGWTVSRAGTGDTTITHSLATASYSIAVTLTNGQAGWAYTAAPGTNSIRIFTVDAAGAALDSDYTFIVARN